MGTTERMSEPNNDTAAAGDRPTGAIPPIEGEPEPAPDQQLSEAQREAEQTIRSISRLEERN